MEKDKWGGKREGGGRKPMGIQPKEPVAYRLDSRVVDILKAQPNQTAFLEKAVLEHKERISEINVDFIYKDRTTKLIRLSMRPDLLPAIGDKFCYDPGDGFLSFLVLTKRIVKTEFSYYVSCQVKLIDDYK